MPTARDLTRQELQHFVDSAKQGIQQRQQNKFPVSQDEQTRPLLFNRLRDAARILRTKYGASRVLLFGSFLHSALWSETSDIDLMVEGLDHRYWQAWREIDNLIPERHIDLVDAAMLSDSLRQTILLEGTEL
jgi:predicted nucleotidyltransferase